MSLQFILKNRTNADTMNEEEYCQQHDTESVRFKDNPDSKPLGVHQQLDVKQTDGKDHHRFNVECLYW